MFINPAIVLVFSCTSNLCKTIEHTSYIVPKPIPKSIFNFFGAKSHPSWLQAGFTRKGVSEKDELLARNVDQMSICAPPWFQKKKKNALLLLSIGGHLDPPNIASIIRKTTSTKIKK